MLGGPPTPGIGFGIGIERILLACDAEGVFPVDPAPLDAFVVDMTGGSAARDLTAALRSAGLSADRAFDDRSMKAQFKAADRSGALVVLIVGPDEAAEGTVWLRPLRGAGDQRTIPVADVVDAVRAAGRRRPTPPDRPDGHRDETTQPRHPEHPPPPGQHERTQRDRAPEPRPHPGATSLRTDLCGTLRPPTSADGDRVRLGGQAT